MPGDQGRARRPSGRGVSASLLATRKLAKEELDRVWRAADDAVVIHYSCESFDQPAGRSPRITSIAARSLRSGQARSFSIHQIAERRGTREIAGNLDDLEQEMLREFFTHAKDTNPRFWIHWNMRDEKYGFQALEHRFLARFHHH